MKLHLVIFFSFLVSLSCSLGFSQKDRPDLLNIYLDTNVILIGDQINLYIQATLPPNVHLVFPDFNDSITSNIEIIEKYQRDTIALKKYNFLKITQKYLITCFDSGLHFIPPMSFNIKQENFDNYITSDSIGLYVGTFEIDTTKGFFDIKPPIKAPLSWNDVKPYIYIIIIILLVLAFLTLLILYIISKKRNLSFFGKSKVVLPPHEIAFKKLDRIKKKKLYQAGFVKRYYTEITDVLRVYLEERYGLHTLEKTTEEIILDIKDLDEIPNELIKKLNYLMQNADLVKFAKKIPENKENEYFWKDVYEFIQTTKLVEEESEEELKDENK